MSKKGKAKKRGKRSKVVKTKAAKKSTKSKVSAKQKPKKAAKRSKTKEASKAKPPEQKKGAEDKRVSALDAAAQVLAKAGKPMRSQEMIVAMAEQGLWKIPAGKTPWATLYSAVIREIATKGKESRFKKTGRGSFTFNG